jgi:hypothetical protein
VHILDHILPLMDLQSLRRASQVDTPRVSPDLAADTARAELERDRCVAVELECDGAALAAAMERPGRVSDDVSEVGLEDHAAGVGTWCFWCGGGVRGAVMRGKDGLDGEDDGDEEVDELC